MFACTVSDCGVRGKFEGRGGVVVQEVDSATEEKEGRKMPIYEQALTKQDGGHD